MRPIRRHVAADKSWLAQDIAARLREVIADAVASRGVAHLVLTGGSMGTALLEALSDDVDATDWSAVHLWWGDERFLPEGDGERNETQARDALLDRLDLPASHVHPMPASDGSSGSDLDAAARSYVDELQQHADAGAPWPAFDVVMLGMGPDTHVASLFPGFPQTTMDAPAAVAVTGSPKPPPERITLTFACLNSAREVWLMIAGADKAEAVRAAEGSHDATAHPASGVHGREATIWWLDEAAARG